MKNEQGLTKRAEWLVYCLEIGFTKEQIPELEKVWDTYKDEYGNLRPTTPSPVQGSVEERWEKSVLIDALQKIRDMKLLKGETDSKYALNRTWHIAVNALNAIQSFPIEQEGKESDAIAFAEWMDENCVFNVKGWFFRDLIDGQVQNEFSIPELYELFKSKNNVK
jgi:hypothetical protein